MKTENEINQDIISVIAKITREFPELVKYINEIPLQITPPSKSSDLKNAEEYYNSLIEILKKYSKTHEASNLGSTKSNTNLPGNQPYPPSEDIYAQAKEEKEIDPENISKNKIPPKKGNTMNELSFSDDMSGDDLDVPGSEYDDEEEWIGNEDEENNYFSLGGENHHDLDENED
jgi:hypothetical protein